MMSHVTIPRYQLDIQIQISISNNRFEFFVHTISDFAIARIGHHNEFR